MRRFGLYGDDYGQRVAVQTDGTIVLTGDFGFQIDLDNQKLVGESSLQGNPGAFMAGLSADGKVRWVTSLHAKQNDYISDIALGPGDSIAVVGHVRSMNAGCGNVRSVNFDDILVGAFDKQGRCSFTHAYGSKENDSGDAIAVDREGNLFVGGTAQKGTSFGGGIVATREAATLFAASFTKSGQHRWSVEIAEKAFSHINAVAVDAEGNSYYGGYAHKTDPNPNATPMLGDSEASLVALSRDGKLRWRASFDGPATEMIDGIVVEPQSLDVIVVGSFSQFVDIGDVHLVSAGGADGFVARLDQKGKLRWARGIGGADHQGLVGVALDAASNLYVTGYTRAPFVFGNTELRTSGEQDALVASLYPDGSPRWGLTFGGPKYDTTEGLAVDPQGRVLVTGTFSEQADFLGTKLKSEGQNDIFVVALRPAAP